MDGGTYAAATMATPALPPLSAAERRPSWVDVGVVAAMLLLGLLGVFLAHDLGGPEDQSRIASWADYTTLVILVLPILVRRMAPAAVCVFVSLFFVAFRLLEEADETHQSEMKKCESMKHLAHMFECTEKMEAPNAAMAGVEKLLLWVWEGLVVGARRGRVAEMRRRHDAKRARLGRHVLR